MIESKTWTVINVSLVLISLLLLLNLLQLEIPALGKSIEQLSEGGFCVMKNFNEEFIERDLSNCCLEQKKLTLSCEKGRWYYQDQILSDRCVTGNGIEYFFNKEGRELCKDLWE